MLRGGRGGGGGNCDDERKRRASSGSGSGGNKRVAAGRGRKRPAFSRWFDLGSSSGAFAGAGAGEGSSSGVLRTLPPPKLEPQDNGPQDNAPPAARAGAPGFLPGDFVEDDDMAEVLERTKKEDEDQEERRRMIAELNELRYRQAIHDSLHVVVDLVSDSDSD